MGARPLAPPERRQSLGTFAVSQQWTGRLGAGWLDPALHPNSAYWLARLKKGMREVDQMTTWIFAGVNQRDRRPPELWSRFVTFDFKPYTREEFLEVAEAVITRQLGKDPDLARYVAERVVLRTKDVRQAIQVAKPLRLSGRSGPV